MAAMKRKAQDDIAADRPRPRPPSIPIRGSSPTSNELCLKQAEPATSTGDDGDSIDGTAPSEPHSTPVTTAHSTTASRRFPSDLKTIHCSWPGCDKSFNRPARLTAHMRSHTNDRPFKCPECAKTYLEEKHLRQHIKGSHTHERRYACDVCDKAFLTATRLRRHAAVHAGQDRFRCRGYDDACTRSFRKHQTLQRHIRVDHLRQPAFVCTHELARTSTAAGASTAAATCEAVFDSAGALRRHVEREHAAPRFWCEECAHRGSTGSTTPASQFDHDAPSAPSVPSAPPAAGVSVGFATRALLEAHMRHEHLNCPFCDTRCHGGPAALHRHIDMHHSGKTVADRKTIACPHAGCSKAFTRRANLNVHIRAAHEGLRFVCGAVAGSGDGGDGDDDESDAGDGHDGSGGAGGGSRNAAPAGPADPELAAWCERNDGCGRGFVSKMKLEEHILYVHLRRKRPAPALLVQDAGPADDADDAAANPAGTATPAAAAAVAMPSADSFIDALLGTNRTIACTVAGCALRFARHHDLNIHLLRDHVDAGVDASIGAPDEALDDTANEYGIRPDEFWIGGGADLDGPAGDGDDGLFNSYIDMDMQGNAADSGAAFDDMQWRIDEAEMRRLIGSDDDSQDVLDPKLFI